MVDTPNKISKKQKLLSKKESEKDDQIELNVVSKKPTDNKKESDLVEDVDNKHFDAEIFAKDTSFKELGVCDELCEILDSLNYKFPTRIQKETLPYTLKRITFVI